MQKLNVFLSWSGQEAREVAELFDSWLRDMLQTCEPFFSDQSIETGARWELEIADRLEQCDFGLIFMTRQSVSSAWLLFEAGALAKSVEKARVCPIMIDISDVDIPAPLANFQGAKIERAPMLALVRALNARVPGGMQLKDERLERQFDRIWSEFERDVQSVRQKYDSAGATEPRSERELLEEVLANVRDQLKIITSLSTLAASPRGVTISRKFTPSNKYFHHEILIYYFEQTSNCLDYIAYCEDGTIKGYTINRNLARRLKEHNVKNRFPELQVETYEGLAAKFSSNIDEIAKQLISVGQGGLLKLAFDLEVGGVFFYIFDDDGDEAVAGDFSLVPLLIRELWMTEWPIKKWKPYSMS